MTANLYESGLMISTGKIKFQTGKLPKEDKLWIDAKHPQFTDAVEWCKAEGLL